MVLVPLSPPPGLDSDDTTFKAEGRWADCNNVRFYNGSPQPIGSYTAAITLTAGQSIVGIGFAGATLGGGYTLLGTSDKLWAGFNLNAPTNVTPVGLPSGNTSWSFATYGLTAMCSPYNGKIYQYTLGGGVATVIATAPVQNRCILVTRRQVLAFGTNEEVSTTFNPRCIRGSDIEDPTNWTTSATNNAFEHVLTDTGTIVAAREIGDYIAVWTSTSLWLGTFVGDPSQTYQWEKIGGAAGAVGLNSVCVVGQVATWLGFDKQIWQWSPGAPPTPLACPISEEFRNNLESFDLALVTDVPHYNEIWLFYADARDGTGDFSRYVAFNQQGQWFRGQLSRAAALSNGLISSLISLGHPTAAGGFLAASGNVVYLHDLSGSAPAWSITSADMYLDNSARRAMVKSVIPDFRDQASDVSLTLYVRDRPQSTAVTKGPYTLTNTATKKDFRASGKIISAKFSGTGFARFGKPLFDTVPMGER